MDVREGFVEEALAGFAVLLAPLVGVDVGGDDRRPVLVVAGEDQILEEPRGPGAAGPVLLAEVVEQEEPLRAGCAPVSLDVEQELVVVLRCAVVKLGVSVGRGR